jgi:hypothetical protein
MSDAIEALSEYKYLLESMGHDAQSTGPYMRCLDAIAALQAMQGQHAGQGEAEHELNILHKSLDGMGVPRHENEVVLSAWGRVVRMPQPAVPDGLHQMIVDYIRDDFETLQDGGDWCVITPEDVEEQLKYLRKHDLLIQHPTDPERVMVAMLSAAKGETE